MTKPPITTLQAILFGGLTVGVLDLADAITFFGIRNHVAPERILYSIASGLLGPAARVGGWDIALLGLCLHFFIATTIVTVYVLASKRVPALTGHTLVLGPAYGVAAWCVMNFVVLPLSAAGRGPLVWPVVTNGILIHIFGVGLPSAIAARAQAPRSTE